MEILETSGIHAQYQQIAVRTKTVGILNIWNYFEAEIFNNNQYYFIIEKLPEYT